MTQRESITVIVSGQPVEIPLADAVAEYLRIDALEPVLRKPEEVAVHVALVAALGTLIISPDGTRPLYEAWKPNP